MPYIEVTKCSNDGRARISNLGWESYMAKRVGEVFDRNHCPIHGIENGARATIVFAPIGRRGITENTYRTAKRLARKILE